ncbi:MAG: electron transfer flavoprotein subunit beta/FixA family protein [Lentimicrobiaceae bacterium]|nr:electron transfer flavoprotein subunit beta/FixA family protein [Lentimicrobiaceae bacterium]MCB9023352.1 electron transfer flavoprotein subunit beta/FixA family protein [Lentimicrobiaceae bacterium]
MRILVCISNVPDTTTKVKFVDEFTKLDVAGIQWVINPWDELALTRALELKDDASNGVQSVTVAHVGLVTSEPTIRKALAIGADDAIRINMEAGDAFSVASQLAEVLKTEKFDIILTGIESSDHNGSTVGGMLAELIDSPSVTCVSSLKVEGDTISVSREIDGGKENLSIPAPFVAVVQKGIAKEPKIAAMRGIMAARTKPIKIFEPVAIESYTQVLSYEMPAPRAACKFVDADNAAQLIDLLQNEARVF